MNAATGFRLFLFASEDAALPILRTPAVQQALFEAFESNELTRVDDEGVHAILQWVRTDPQDIRPLLDTLTRAAMAVDDARIG